MKSQSFLVVGGGSMGKRRIRCLLAHKIQPEQIRMIDTQESRRTEVKEKHGVEGMNDLSEGFRWNPDAVIISVPGAYHMEVCLAAARAGKHFFVEVPLSTDLQGAEELISLVQKNKLIAAPGVQTPFHPFFKKLKEWLQEPSFGKPLQLLVEFGQYLPDWHPYEDYRKFYASNQKLGGGNLDVIAQELATLYWLLDDRIIDVFSRGRKLSTLEILANDSWQLVATSAKGTAMMMQFDMIQRAGRNFMRFISESGTIELDLTGGTLRRFLASTKQWESLTVPQGYVYEQCYIDEIGLFLRCINEGDRWHNPLPVAIDIVRFLGAMQQSARESTLVKI